MRFEIEVLIARVWWWYWGWRMRRAVRHGMIYPHIDD